MVTIVYIFHAFKNSYFLEAHTTILFLHSLAKLEKKNLSMAYFEVDRLEGKVSRDQWKGWFDTRLLAANMTVRHCEALQETCSQNK